MPQAAPPVEPTECVIRERVKDPATYESAPYCIRCNVWVDPDVPHVPVVASEHDGPVEDRRP